MKEKEIKSEGKVQNTFKHKLVELIVKTLTLRFLNKQEKLESDQQRAVHILRLFLKKPNSEVLWAPNSVRYIKSDEYFVKLKSERISIINHNTRHDIWIPQETFDKIVEEIDEEIDNRVQKMEHEIVEQVSSSLDIILRKLQDKLENGD